MIDICRYTGKRVTELADMSVEEEMFYAFALPDAYERWRIL